MNDIISFLTRISLKDIIDFIVNPKLEGPFFYIKIIFIIISFVFSALIIVFLFLTSWFKYRYSYDFKDFLSFKPIGQDTEKIAASKKWAKITQRLSSKKEADLKLAVIEADELLDKTTKQIGYQGDTFEERVKGASVLIDLKKVLEAHSLRNDIVFNKDYTINQDEAVRIVKIFEEALKGLGAI
ncbi:MAG: hypothetical protein PHI53_00075 [Candidatus Pacebacteria bacterium]|nr:hypothetical protein [Candidatus Paceibacterota bacterium]